MPTRRLAFAFLTSLLAIGCQAAPPATLTVTPLPAAPSAAATTATAAPVAVAAAATVALSGVATAPIGIAGIISTNGGGVVPTGGGLYRVAALSEAPLQGTTVYLADAKGEAYPGVAPVTTDAAGRFTFPAVPRDLTVMVVAAAYDQGRKKPAFMRTLVNPAQGGTEPVAINAASTVVTVDVVEGRTELGTFNPSAFKAATAATAAGLADGDAPDFTDAQALRAKAKALADANAQLKADLDRTRQDLEALKEELKRLEEQLRQPPASPPPTPASTPAPVATATPMPATTPTPGQQPPFPPTTCSSPIQKDIFLRGTYTGYPLTVEVYAPQGANPVAMCTIPAPGGFGTLSLPTGCAHRWLLKSGATTIAKIDSWTINEPAPRQIYPPF